MHKAMVPFRPKDGKRKKMKKMKRRTRAKRKGIPIRPKKKKR
jgi:hypothetical protein